MPLILTFVGTDGAARMPMSGSSLPRRLPFQPRLGFRQIAQRAGEPARGAAFRPRRHRARLAHRLDSGVTGGKRTAKEQQIAHGFNSGRNVRQYRPAYLNAA
jgi:hypothetical protein